MENCLIFDKKSLHPKPKRYRKYSRYFIYEVYWHRVLPCTMDEFDRDMLLSYS